MSTIHVLGWARRILPGTIRGMRRMCKRSTVGTTLGMSSRNVVDVRGSMSTIHVLGLGARKILVRYVV